MIVRVRLCQQRTNQCYRLGFKNVIWTPARSEWTWTPIWLIDPL